jgi:uncharacterized membrane protein
MQNILSVILIILGLGGFFLASYIHRKKRAKKKMICPMHSNCDTVIHSDYSRILGIPVEVLGMTFYLFIVLSYTLALVSGYWTAAIAFILLGASICSVLFSVYLVSLQMFILKHWCIWCMSSALISLFILIFSYLHVLLY